MSRKLADTIPTSTNPANTQRPIGKCIHMYVLHIFIYTHTYILMFIHLSVYLCLYVCVCVYVYIYICTCIYLHTYIHTYIHQTPTSELRLGEAQRLRCSPALKLELQHQPGPCWGSARLQTGTLIFDRVKLLCKTLKF